MDIYAPDMRQHARVEYWDDEIDSLASFDLLTQRRDGCLLYTSNAVVHIGVYAQHGVGAVERLGGRDHDALLVGASLLIGGDVYKRQFRS